MPIERSDAALSRAATTTHAKNVRLAIIESLAPALSSLVTTPGVAVSDPVRQALRHALGAYEALVESASRSNPGYTFRDLPSDESALYERAKHLLDVLDVLHGPKAAS